MVIWNISVLKDGPENFWKWEQKFPVTKHEVIRRPGGSFEMQPATNDVTGLTGQSTNTVVYKRK